jgi:transposase
MARAVSLPQRQVICERAEHGDSAEEVARDLGLRPSTVRKLYARFRARGRAGLAPAYDRCGQGQTTADTDLIAAALDMRRQHAGWGAGLIRVLLAEQYADRMVPCERTLQRCFARAGLGPAPKGRRPQSGYQRATRPHQVWQIDAAERMRVGDGTEACWLRLVDECTGAFLHTKVFPPGRLEHGAADTDASRVATGVPDLGPAGRLAG